MIQFCQIFKTIWKKWDLLRTRSSNMWRRETKDCGPCTVKLTSWSCQVFGPSTDFSRPTCIYSILFIFCLFNKTNHMLTIRKETYYVVGTFHFPVINNTKWALIVIDYLHYLQTETIYRIEENDFWGFLLDLNSRCRCSENSKRY